MKEKANAKKQIEKTILNLTLKMALTNLIQNQRGAPVPVTIPPGYKPTSLDVNVSWPPIFPPTMEDIQKKVTVGVSVANASIISRETITRWLAQEFDVENIEDEVAKVAAQPVINPFGAF